MGYINPFHAETAHAFEAGIELERARLKKIKCEEEKKEKDEREKLILTDIHNQLELVKNSQGEEAVSSTKPKMMT